MTDRRLIVFIFLALVALTFHVCAPDPHVNPDGTWRQR